MTKRNNNKNIAKNIEKRFNTLNYEIDRPLPMEKNKKIIGIMKDELGRQFMKKFVRLRAKTYSNLKDDNDEDKKAKETKKCHKKKLKFKDYKKILKDISNFKYNKLSIKERN